MSKLITDSYIGKRAIKSRGFFGGLIGVIGKNGEGSFAPYYIEFRSGSRAGISYLHEIELLGEEHENKRL